MLQDPDLKGEALGHCLYFLCHALRQPEVDRPAEAAVVAEEALIGELTPELWGKFSEARAMSLYDLNRFAELSPILDDIRNRDVVPSVRGHEIALRGMLLSKQADPEAFEYLRDAESHFAAIEHHFGCAWVQVAAASLALKLDRFSDTVEWADKVTYSRFVPVAKLLGAEAMYRDGQVAEGSTVVDRVEAGEFGPVVGDMPARCSYLRALFALGRGDMLAASRHLSQAYQHLSQQQRQSIDLGTAMAGLRTTLLREGVA